MKVPITLGDEKIKYLCHTDKILKQLIYSIGAIENFSLEKDYLGFTTKYPMEVLKG